LAGTEIVFTVSPLSLSFGSSGRSPLLLDSPSRQAPARRLAGTGLGANGQSVL